jgi:hypothetical protein
MMDLLIKDYVLLNSCWYREDCEENTEHLLVQRRLRGKLCLIQTQIVLILGSGKYAAHSNYTI